MKTSAAAPETEERNIAFIVIIVLLVVAVVAIVVALVVRREPDYALVLATPQDCLRAFDDTKCREIVARATTIHAASAPRYRDQNICEFAFGEGGCTPMDAPGDSFYAPTIAAIVLVRGTTDDSKSMLPIYFGSRPAATQGDGRRVFYHGLAVGILRSTRVGGGAMSILTNLAGAPLTSDDVRRLRRS